MAQQKKSHKLDRQRKSGSNLAYKGEQRHEKSHERRIKRHLMRYSKKDKIAVDALMRYAEKLGLKHLNSAREFVKNV